MARTFKALLIRKFPGYDGLMPLGRRGRIKACLLAEAPFVTHVVFGIPDKNFAATEKAPGGE
jgi:hypothetical protein